MTQTEALISRPFTFPSFYTLNRIYLSNLFSLYRLERGASSQRYSSVSTSHSSVKLSFVKITLLALLSSPNELALKLLQKAAKRLAA